MDEASKIASAGNLHQCLWLTETSSHGRLRVTFATTSNFSDSSLPVLLFCGPMFGSRWMILDMDHLAVESGVRVICTDRPGIGGSTQVPLQIRMQVWLETVPTLLGVLNVQHIRLFCHSAGTMYALNTLYHLRHMLDPQAPYFACIAPWVNNEHPYTALMRVASKVPNGLMDYWDSTIKLIERRVTPVISWSGGIISSTGHSTNTQPRVLADKYGANEEVGREVERMKVKYLFTEDTTGVNDEARLCLKKEGSEGWGICEDYAEFVQGLAKLEQVRLRSSLDRIHLEVHAYFASSDVMIGRHGQEYFEQCWRQPGVETFITFKSEILQGTDHDSVVTDSKNGALKSIFKQAKA